MFFSVTIRKNQWAMWIKWSVSSLWFLLTCKILDLETEKTNENELNRTTTSKYLFLFKCLVCIKCFTFYHKKIFPFNKPWCICNYIISDRKIYNTTNIHLGLARQLSNYLSNSAIIHFCIKIYRFSLTLSQNSYFSVSKTWFTCLSSLGRIAKYER